MKRVSEILHEIVLDRVCHSLCSEFVNSFARRQHVFDIAPKPIDVYSNFYLVLLRVSVPISPET